MPRLIDADAFDEVIQNAQTECKKSGGNFRYGVLSNVRANLAKMPTVGGWISVKDRLPEEEKDVLVARYWVDKKNKQMYYVEIAKLLDEDWLSDSDEYKIGRHYDPYAWMPLPEPPKEDV